MENNGKATGVIEKCCLQKPPFDRVDVSFSWVNFFFGKNAAGKSTVAEAIAQKEGLTCRDGDSAFAVYHFNQDYVDRNMRMYAGLPGIFSLGQQEGDAAERLKEVQGKLEEARQQRDKVKQLTSDLQARKDAIIKKHYDTCWKKTENYRNSIFSLALRKFNGSKSAFEAELQKQDTSLVRSEAEILSEYKRVFESKGTTYPDYASIADAYHVLSADDEALLEQVIAAKEDTPYARFLGRLKAQDWARHGHDRFQEAADGKCPYCGQALPDNFEEVFRHCFDDQYQADIARIEVIRQNYQEMCRKIERILDGNEIIKCPFNEALAYSANSAKLKNVLASNLHALEQKARNPSMPVKLDTPDELIRSLETARQMVNKSIAINNAAVKDTEKAKQACLQAILTFVASKLQKEFAECNQAMEIFRKAFEKCDQDYAKYDQEHGRLEKEAASLQQQCANSEIALNNIKRMLKESGFTNFSIRRKLGTPHTYEVYRPEKSELGRLSEGERNFLAFLYFYQELCGACPEGTIPAKRVVVIDDPVSSMDSGVISIVASFIRKLVKICLSKQGGEPLQNNGEDIRQIFIFSHNDFFFELVSTPFLRDPYYKYVSFFKVMKKAVGHSSIEACLHNHPVNAGQKKNYCPVKNSYVVLWDEYADLRNTDHIPALMNVIRQILERYFILISRHDSDSLDALIEAHSSEFQNLSEGAENDYILAKSLVASIGAYESGGDHMLIPQEDMDASQCQRIFEMIFRALGQGEHYRMMMGLA